MEKTSYEVFLSTVQNCKKPPKRQNCVPTRSKNSFFEENLSFDFSYLCLKCYSLLTKLLVLLSFQTRNSECCPLPISAFNRDLYLTTTLVSYLNLPILYLTWRPVKDSSEAHPTKMYISKRWDGHDQIHTNKWRKWSSDRFSVTSILFNVQSSMKELTNLHSLFTFEIFWYSGESYNHPSFCVVVNKPSA